MWRDGRWMRKPRPPLPGSMEQGLSTALSHLLQGEHSLTNPKWSQLLHRRRAKRYHGSVKLDATRVGRDAGQIADEVIAHLSALVGADVQLTLEIEAHIPEGTPEHVIRTSYREQPDTEVR